MPGGTRAGTLGRSRGARRGASDARDGGERVEPCRPAGREDGGEHAGEPAGQRRAGHDAADHRHEQPGEPEAPQPEQVDDEHRRGGDVDEEDDYQELIDQAQESEMSQNIFDLISEMGNDVVSNAGAGISPGTGFQSFSAPDNKNAEFGIKAGRGEDKGDLIGRLRAEIMQRESGGRRYDKDGNLTKIIIFCIILVALITYGITQADTSDNSDDDLLED